MSSEFGERLEMAQDAFNDLLQERDTLITALRECVVALESVSEEIEDMSGLLIDSEDFEDSTIGKAWKALLKHVAAPALGHSKSTLERYGDK